MASCELIADPILTDCAQDAPPADNEAVRELETPEACHVTRAVLPSPDTARDGEPVLSMISSRPSHDTLPPDTTAIRDSILLTDVELSGRSQAKTALVPSSDAASETPPLLISLPSVDRSVIEDHDGVGALLPPPPEIDAKIARASLFVEGACDIPRHATNAFVPSADSVALTRLESEPSEI